MLLVYSDSFLHHLLPLADAAVWVTDAALLMANALAAAPVHPEPAAGEG